MTRSPDPRLAFARWCLLALCCANPFYAPDAKSQAQTQAPPQPPQQPGGVVRVGRGSYATAPPPGAKLPQRSIHRSDSPAAAGPMPTNDWWSSLAWMPFSEPHFPHPLAVHAQPAGLRLHHPGPSIRADRAAVMGPMPGGTRDDLVIGNAGGEPFDAALVDRHSDWFVGVAFTRGGRAAMRCDYGHGSPFVFVDTLGGDATLRFQRPVKPSVREASFVAFTVNRRHYAAFPPAGATWEGLDGPTWTCRMNGQAHLTVALLPDDRPETLALFARHARQRVTDTRVSWSYDPASSLVETRFEVTTRGDGAPGAPGAPNEPGPGTLMALYPHQWRHTDAPLLGHAYASVRGPMKLVAGHAFTTRMRFQGVLPGLPEVGAGDPTRLRALLRESVSDSIRPGDTYWMGKELGRLATLIPLAEQLGDEDSVARLSAAVRGGLEGFLDAGPADRPDRPDTGGLFVYDRLWGTLIGYPASFGSDTELNDHHFHYGYFLRAAGEIARRDPAWAAPEAWGGMLRLLVRDIASPERGDAMFPFLRCFDPYAGHSWASGHARFGDGNNNESSSEAMNAWYGFILLGEATGDRPLRDLGVWLHTTEAHAIHDYWFDSTDQLLPPSYPASVVTMVWGGKGANGTWFTANPEQVHGINWLPIHGGSLYLGHRPDYVLKNFQALVAENQGENWDAWADLVFMYLALADGPGAVRRLDAGGPQTPTESGNSKAHTLHWVHTLNELGQPDTTVWADSPLHAVFNKAGRRSRVAYNAGREEREVRFSDGVRLRVAPGRFTVQRD